MPLVESCRFEYSNRPCTSSRTYRRNRTLAGDLAKRPFIPLSNPIAWKKGTYTS